MVKDCYSYRFREKKKRGMERMETLIGKHIEIITQSGLHVCGTIREVFPKFGTVMVYGDPGYAYRTCVAIEDIKGED